MDQSPNDSVAKGLEKEAGNYLQWFRELITAGISVVILVVATETLWGTYRYASNAPTEIDDRTRAAYTEAYNQQKDIMLYALALLGTVTGYYLGRVPAELHAQQARRSANAAQDQLQKTHSKLTDTASNAAIAASQLTVAQEQKNAAKERLSEASEALEDASQAISQTLGERVRKAAPGEGLEGVEELEPLREAKERIDTVLRQIRRSSI